MVGGVSEPARDLAPAPPAAGETQRLYLLHQRAPTGAKQVTGDEFPGGAANGSAGASTPALRPRSPHWMGERDYVRDLALEEREHRLQQLEDEYRSDGRMPEQETRGEF